MKSQHTPGPWLVNYAEDRFDSKRSTIEIVDGSYDSLNHEQGPLVLAKLNVIPFAPHMDEPLANARLIASAPDLLAALEIILSSTCGDIGDDGYDGCIRIEAKALEHVRAAIFKATGGAA
jgi:hypothetical protein